MKMTIKKKKKGVKFLSDYGCFFFFFIKLSSQSRAE